MAEHNEEGKWGEEQAARYLKEKGYIILERNWRNGRSRRDIDIICRTPDLRTVVFVEVKARSNLTFGRPEQAVDRRKMFYLLTAASAYIQQRHIVEHLRFDIISIVGHRNAPLPPQIRHIEGAFTPMQV